MNKEELLVIIKDTKEENRKLKYEAHNMIVLLRYVGYTDKEIDRAISKEEGSL